ncbi:MAG: hypothetical protein J0I41_23225 [Filimonas sp.]|nr:hypothetical protein [Filimonas sp.]
MNLNDASLTTDDLSDKKAVLRKWAHDFQNPVSSIQLIAEYLRGQEPDAEKAGDLQNILTCCDDLNKLIDDLLAKEASF